MIWFEPRGSLRHLKPDLSRQEPLRSNAEPPTTARSPKNGATRWATTYYLTTTFRHVPTVPPTSGQLRGPDAASRNVGTRLPSCGNPWFHPPSKLTGELRGCCSWRAALAPLRKKLGTRRVAKRPSSHDHPPLRPVLPAWPSPFAAPVYWRRGLLCAPSSSACLHDSCRGKPSIPQARPVMTVHVLCGRVRRGGSSPPKPRLCIGALSRCNTPLRAMSYNGAALVMSFSASPPPQPGLATYCVDLWRIARPSSPSFSSSYLSGRYRPFSFRLTPTRHGEAIGRYDLPSFLRGRQRTVAPDRNAVLEYFFRVKLGRPPLGMVALPEGFILYNARDSRIRILSGLTRRSRHPWDGHAGGHAWPRIGTLLSPIQATITKMTVLLECRWAGWGFPELLFHQLPLQAGCTMVAVFFGGVLWRYVRRPDDGPALLHSSFFLGISALRKWFTS